MKKIIFLICVNNIILWNAHGMEQPPSSLLSETEIPLAIKSKFEEEKKRFQKYDLDNSDHIFLPLIRKEFQKDKNVEEYLNNLQLFASILLLQHTAMQAVAERAYITDYFLSLKKLGLQYLKELGGKAVQQEQEGIWIEGRDVGKVLAHSKLLTKQELLSPDEIAIIFSWVNPNNSKQLQTLGRKIINNNERIMVLVLENQATSKFYKILSQEMVNQLTNIVKARFIEINSSYLNGILNNETNTFVRQTSVKKRYSKEEQETKLALSIADYQKENLQIVSLYELTHQWYSQMYALVRAEMNMVIKELIEQNRGNIQLTQRIINKTLLMPPPARASEFLPKKLPLTLDPFKKASELISLPSFDKQLEKARLAFEKMQNEEKLQRAAQIREARQKTKKSVSATQEEATEEEELKNDISISIHNPVNKTTEIIFKTDKPFQIKKPLPPINYTEWINAWFTNPQKALETQGYLDPKNKNKFTAEHLRWKPIALHAFSPEIDNYIKEWGTATSIPSRRYPGKQDILVTIPGMIKYPAGSEPKEETGVFAYIIDSENGQWYHRMFEPQTGQKLIADLFEKGYFSPEMTGYYAVYFPALPSKK